MRESTYQEYCAQIEAGANLPELRQILTRALHERKLAAAKFGLHAPFEVTDAIGKLENLLARLDRRRDQSPAADPAQAAEDQKPAQHTRRPTAGEQKQAEEARRLEAEARRQAEQEAHVAKLRAVYQRNLAHYLAQVARSGLSDIAFHTVQGVAQICGSLRQLGMEPASIAPPSAAEPLELSAAELFAPRVLRYLERDQLAQIEQTLRSTVVALEKQRDYEGGAPPVALALDRTRQAAEACRAAQES
ncbi:MAG TPA: hypothetical protein VGE07_13820 [Herpetosiphonaceae bacterium]